MPSLEEQIEALADQITNWQIQGIGSQTWMRHKKASAMEAIALLEQRMTVEHIPIASSISEGSEKGVLWNFGVCNLCRRDIERKEDPALDQWKDWFTTDSRNPRCFGLVQP